MPYLSSCKISYLEFESKSDMDHAEATLIKIKKPLLNIAGKTYGTFPFLLDSKTADWIPYNEYDWYFTGWRSSKIEEKFQEIEKREKDLAEIRHELLQHQAKFHDVSLQKLEEIIDAQMQLFVKMCDAKR